MIEWLQHPGHGWDIWVLALHCAADWIISGSYFSITLCFVLWRHHERLVWREVASRIRESSRVFGTLFFLGGAEHGIDALADFLPMGTFLLVEKVLKAGVALWVAAALWRRPTITREFHR